MNGRTNVGGGGGQEFYTLKLPNGDTQLLQLEGEESFQLTATENDIRLGKRAVTSKGPTDGTKDIPQYRTTEGVAMVDANETFRIELSEFDKYDYTKLQAMTMPYINESIKDSVAVDRAVIEDKVYNVGETIAVATVTKDSTNKSILLGITNGDTPAVIRYFTYKKEEI